MHTVKSSRYKGTVPQLPWDNPVARAANAFAIVVEWARGVADVAFDRANVSLAIRHAIRIGAVGAWLLLFSAYGIAPQLIELAR